MRHNIGEVLILCSIAMTCNVQAQVTTNSAAPTAQQPSAGAGSPVASGSSTSNDADLGGLLDSAPTPPAPVGQERAPNPPAQAPAASPLAENANSSGQKSTSTTSATTAGSSNVPVTEQPASSATPKRVVRSALMEEIIVTAQKREESVQDVPIAINAFNGEQLKALGVTNQYDLSAVVPGLQATDAVGFSVTYLRGVGTDAFLMADPSVALYVDDVYLPFAMAANQKFGEMDRTEVLKGPQGTLFGRNAVGGAINVVTKKPNFDKASFQVDLDAGDYSAHSEKVFANIPVFSNLALSVSGLYDTRDSYYKGVMGESVSNPHGNPVAGEKNGGVQVKTRYAPFDWVELNLNWTHIEDRGVGGLYSPNDDPSPLGTALGIKAQKGFNNTATNENATLGVLNNIYAGNLKFHWDVFDMKLLGSRQRIKSDNDIDFDGSPVPVASFKLKNEFADIYTGEFQLLSNNSSWGADRWSWILGGYYFQGNQGVNPSTLNVLSTNLNEGTVFGIAVPPSIIDLIDAAGLGASIPAGSLIFDGIIGTNSKSGYFQSTFHFTDWAALTLGGRYQSENRSIIDSRSFLEAANGGDGVLLFDSDDKSKYPDISTKKFSPKVSLEFRPFDGTLAYATWQTAVKSATYNVINVISNAQQVKAEQLESFEVGVKSDFLDGLIRANAAGFLYHEKNQQVQFVSLLAGGAINFQNAPRSQIVGGDFDVTADILPNVLDGVYLTASGAYLDAKFTDYNDCDGFNAQTGLFSNQLDCTNNKIPRSPTFSGRTGLNKIFALENGKVEVAGDIYYNTGYYTAATNVEASKQPAYKLVNARLTYSYDPFNLSVTGFVRNITNTQYSLSKLDTDFGSITALAAPRTIGVQLAARY